ncbi:putative thymidylate kinase [Candidatus Methanobinarius endosymbioticus]|uniref:Probable thymidylate kinase n=1 Tax=Candidatus Methanobinarius endosymbioticus TaxID=2006182 RepID=A0A366MBY0_9EURY|nr:putative thymidylate kinase [Candidatus Methanobinarius endosymbioticus]
MYIVLEGIDGAGKSTQITVLKQWLEDSGIEVETILEPTDSDVGVLIRKMLQDPNATKENFQKALGLLFAADRLMLMDKIDNEEYCNKVIISDRSFYSSLVYQKPKDWITEINKFAKQPDLVLLLDLDVDLAIERCSGEDEFEKKSFLTEVKNNYLELAKEFNGNKNKFKNNNENINDNKNKFTIINANNGPKKVQSDIRKVVAPLLGFCVSELD